MRKACFTMQHNEQFFLPMWVKYYSQFFVPSDIHILAHNCTGPTEELLKEYEAQGIKIYRLTSEAIFDHDWLLNSIQGFQRDLLEDYDYVVFTDCDEFLVPTDTDLGTFIYNATEDAYRAHGFDVMEDKMYQSNGFDKTLISKIPLTWCHGYHFTSPEYPYAPNLNLYHLHKLSYQECWERNQRLSQEKWDAHAVNNHLGTQNLISEKQAFDKMFYTTAGLLEQDEYLKRLLDYIT